jgi:hypothetical protein
MLILVRSGCSQLHTISSSFAKRLNVRLICVRCNWDYSLSFNLKLASNNSHKPLGNYDINRGDSLSERFSFFLIIHITKWAFMLLCVQLIPSEYLEKIQTLN